jgi:hypothetical protein
VRRHPDEAETTIRPARRNAANGRRTVLRI